MNEYDVKRLALILAIQADIEGMKIENKVRLSNNQSPAYPDGEFMMKSEELRELAYKHNEQL